MRLAAIISLPVLAVLASFGCGEKPGASPGASGAPGAGAIPPADSALKAARSLTDDKLSRFAVYEREMIPSLALSAQLMSKASKAGGGTSGVAKALAGDERTKILETTQKEARRKSGLEPVEVDGLNRLTTEFYTQMGIARDFEGKLKDVRKTIDEARAAGKEPSPFDTAMEKAYAETLGKVQATKEKYTEMYGKDAVEIMSRHIDEFVEINDQKLKAFLSPVAK